MRLNHFAKTSRNYYGLTLVYLLPWSTSRARRLASGMPDSWRYERSTRWPLCVVSGSHMTGPFFSPKPCDSRTMYSGRALASS